VVRLWDAGASNLRFRVANVKFQNGKGTKLRLEKTILRGFEFLLAIYDVKLCILRNGSGRHRLLSGSDGARGDFRLGRAFLQNFAENGQNGR
jgi:hypothetical protein